MSDVLREVERRATEGLNTGDPRALVVTLSSIVGLVRQTQSDIRRGRELTVRIVETTRALDTLFHLWPDGHPVIQIHSLPHTIIHAISGHEQVYQRRDRDDDRSLAIDAQSIGGRRVTFFGVLDRTCERCCELASVKLQAAVPAAVCDQAAPETDSLGNRLKPCSRALGHQGRHAFEAIG